MPFKGIRPSTLFLAGAFAFITIPRMTQAGMFLDGITYAVIARNLALGLGSFWSPFYTATVYPQFHEQPPLGFALQAIPFAVAGDHLAVERIYSLTMGCLTALLTIAIWRTTVRDREHAWLPIVFWLLPSTVTWSIVNNMLENTQTVFTTASVFAFARSLTSKSGRGGIAWAAAGGLLVMGAVLVKGPNGFFPLAAPVAAALFVRDRAAAALRSGAVMLAAVVLAALCVLLPAPARAALTDYWNQHLAAALSGERGGGRLAAVMALARHLAGGIVLRMGAMLGLFWLAARLSRVRRSETRRSEWAAFFLTLGLAASLPVIVSTKIAGHYLVPSIPLFALGCAALALPIVEALQQRAVQRRAAATTLGALGAVLLLTALLVPLLPVRVEPRDVAWIEEYRRIGSSLRRGTTLGTCDAASNDWGLHAYMQRFFRVSLDTQSREHDYYLQLTDRACDAPAQCVSVTTTTRLTLFACGAK